MRQKLVIRSGAFIHKSVLSKRGKSLLDSRGLLSAFFMPDSPRCLTGTFEKSRGKKMAFEQVCKSDVSFPLLFIHSNTAHLHYGDGFAGMPCNAFCIAFFSALKMRKSLLRSSRVRAT